MVDIICLCTQAHFCFRRAAHRYWELFRIEGNLTIKHSSLCMIDYAKPLHFILKWGMRNKQEKLMWIWRMKLWSVLLTIRKQYKTCFCSHEWNFGVQNITRRNLLFYSTPSSFSTGLFYLSRLQFCQGHSEGPKFYDKILFTNKATLRRRVVLNWHNSHTYPTVNSHDFWEHNFHLFSRFGVAFLDIVV